MLDREHSGRQSPRERSLIGSLARLFAAVAVVLLPMSVAWDNVIAPTVNLIAPAAAQIEGHCVAFCDEPAPSAPSSGGGGFGDYGGGCAPLDVGAASYAPSAATPGPVGSQYLDYPNVVWNANGEVEAAPFCEFLNDDPGDYRVTCGRPGSPHPQYANVVWGESGYPVPGPFCEWVNDDPYDYRVTCGRPGSPHPQYANVVWSDSGDFAPAAGCSWLNDIPGDYRVVCAAPPPAPTSTAAAPTAPAILPRGTSLAPEPTAAASFATARNCGECGWALVHNIEARLDLSNVGSDAAQRQYVIQAASGYANCAQRFPGECEPSFGTDLAMGIAETCLQMALDAAFLNCARSGVVGARAYPHVPD